MLFAVILETPPAEVPAVVEPAIDDEHNTTNLIQTYISTNQISERTTSDENGVFNDGAPDIGVENVIGETTVIENHVSTTNDEGTFRKPPPPPPPVQKPTTNNNENVANANGKPTREIVSCFMTTGGFISPAREGKLPEARKPIFIAESPEPEEIPSKQRTPSPEIVDRKHHSKRDNKSDNTDALKNYGIDSANASHIGGAYGDEENGKEVKLYEVIQTVPDALPKKKTKKSQLEIAQLKEQKKQKKLQQMKANRNLTKVGANQPFGEHFIKGDCGELSLQSVLFSTWKFQLSFNNKKTLISRHGHDGEWQVQKENA